jgi:Xaa-Pro aminopeptidase
MRERKMFECELTREKLRQLEAMLAANSVARTLILGNRNIQYILGVESSGFFYMDLDSKSYSVYVAPIDYSKILKIIEDCGLSFEIVVYGKLTELTSVTATRVYPNDYNALLRRIISDNRNIGVNMDALPYELRSEFSRSNDEKIRDISAIISQVRALKTEKEKQAIKKSSEITEKAVLQTINEIDDETTVREFKSKLIHNLYMNGAESLAFEPIVVVDSDASYPHPPESSSASGRKIKNSSLFLIDVGAKKHGYSSDMTRIVLYSSSNRLNELAEFLEYTYWVAIDKISEGTPCRDADLEARRYLSRLGLDKYFIHSLGHGVGIEVHEPPYISPFSKDTFSDNNVFTIEPGIYFRNRLGLRVENTLVLEKNRVESFMNSSLVIR